MISFPTAKQAQCLTQAFGEGVLLTESRYPWEACLLREQPAR